MPLGVLTKTDYQDLMQNPGVYLTDPELKRFQVEKDPNDLPRVRSGGLALTYKLSANGHKLALRCFHKVSPRREQHYSAISGFLSSTPSPILIKTSYQPKGINYQGGFYPITLMDWIEGDILGTYVFNHFNNCAAMSELLSKFQQLVNELNRLKIAHGDLSQSNIMLTNGRMILIDYDGMYVPELNGSESIELGNRSFQHPSRTEKNFSQDLDRFSEIVIYLALKAISISPALYQKYGKGREGLLFTYSDFLDPNSSTLINEIEKVPELGVQIQNFKQICQSDITNVPSLDDFVSELTSIVVRPKSTKSYKLADGSYAIDAHNIEELLKKENENVVVIGRIELVKVDKNYKGDPYAFLIFGPDSKKSFRIVLWPETLSQFQKAGISPDFFKDTQVSVSGVISKYGYPYILLESPANIAIVPQVDAENVSILEQYTNSENLLNVIPTEKSNTTDTTANIGALNSSSQFSREMNLLEGLSKIYGPNGTYENWMVTSPHHVKSQRIVSNTTIPSEPVNTQSSHSNTIQKIGGGNPQSIRVFELGNFYLMPFGLAHIVKIRRADGTETYWVDKSDRDFTLYMEGGKGMDKVEVELDFEEMMLDFKDAPQVYTCSCKEFCHPRMQKLNEHHQQAHPHSPFSFEIMKGKIPFNPDEIPY